MTSGGPVARLAGVEVGGAAPVRVMAVINVSPESFHKGSVSAGAAALRDRARQCADQGADIIDIGAMSTAPYLRTEIGADEERARMVAAVEAVAAAVDLPISADTTRPLVARAALAAGATIVNDVAGLRSPAMAQVAAAAAGVVVMASPAPDETTAADEADAADPLAIVRADLERAIGRARDAGVAADRLVIDPGIGFYTKTRWPAVEFNAAVLRSLRDLQRLGHPLLVGVSRKSFIGALTGRRNPGERLAGSLAATAIAVWNGAAMVRTHDVDATRDVVRVVRGLM